MVLGYSTVRTGISWFVGNGNKGDRFPYRYPVGVLKDTKNLVYDNGSTVIYKVLEIGTHKHLPAMSH